MSGSQEAAGQFIVWISLKQHSKAELNIGFDSDEHNWCINKHRHVRKISSIVACTNVSLIRISANFYASPLGSSAPPGGKV